MMEGVENGRGNLVRRRMLRLHRPIAAIARTANAAFLWRRLCFAAATTLRMTEITPSAALASHKSQGGRSLSELSRDSRLLVVFLRHAGCPFCREALAELSRKRAAIESTPARIVLVHMMNDEQAQDLFRKYGLNDVDRVSDPGQSLYRALGLTRGSAAQVMGPRTWWRGFKTAILSGHLPGKPIGDVFQMPGAFVVEDGRILRAFRADTSAAKPDYCELAK
jgi:peroxiredoxin